MEVEVAMARFDQAQAVRSYDLPALLLRSESSSSSQIERLTSSIRDVTLAELTDKAPANALTITGNVAAMREALRQQGPSASIRYATSTTHSWQTSPKRACGTSRCG